MRVLFMTPLNPYPPVTGAQRVSLEAIKLYALFGQVDLLLFYDQTEEDVPALLEEHLGSFCRRIAAVPIPLVFGKHRLKQMLHFARTSTGSLPFRAQKFWCPPMISLFKQWLETGQYDLLHFDFVTTTPYARLARDYPAKKVCLEHNVEWELSTGYAERLRNPVVRLTMRREANRMRAYEVNALNQMEAVMVLSKRDGEGLRSAGVERPIHLFRPCVRATPEPITTFEKAEPVMISLGTFLYKPNEHAVLWGYEHVWHRVLQRLPNVRWHLLGTSPPPHIRKLHDGKNLFVEGFVKDLDSFLKKVRACIVPVQIGAGIRIKILDMWSYGIPCVSTSLGAQGLESEGVWIADEPEGFAEGAVRVLTEPALWHRMSEAGRQFVKQHHSPERVAEEFQTFLTQTLGLSVTR